MEPSVAKRASGKRPKKAHFRGNQFISAKRIRIEKPSGSNGGCAEGSSPSSSSARKLSVLPCMTGNGTVLSVAVPKQGEIPVVIPPKKQDKRFDGYIFVDKSTVFNAIEQAVCCKICGGEITLSDTVVNGLSSKVYVNCSKCGEVASTRNSKMIGEKSNVPEINRRFTYAMRCVGLGYAATTTFCAVMDLPPPVSRKPYENITRKIRDTTACVAKESMQASAKEEIALTENMSHDITISGDGTWKTRGHTSQVGVCTVIGAESGKVIDVEVMSSFCRGCSSWSGPRCGQKFEEWQKTHEQVCSKNHDGSAGKMEVDGMIRIFQRSQTERDVRYCKYIGDGDAKTFSAVSNSKPYGDFPLEKIECVGHVQKRMGTRLRKLKQEWRGRKLSDGKTIGGKNRLTDSAIDKISAYYGNAIRANSNNYESMRSAVWAIFFHKFSTDEEPLHSFCPKGPQSWCQFQKAVANGTVAKFKHTSSLPRAIMETVRKVFRDLSQPELLKRCLGGRTQNSNESLNSLIWQFCPKTSGAGRVVVETAVNEAVVQFNDGRKGRLQTMGKMGLTVGRNAVTAHFARDQMRVSVAEKRTFQNTLQARRAKKMLKVNTARSALQAEGAVYAAGAF